MRRYNYNNRQKDDPAQQTNFSRGPSLLRPTVKPTPPPPRPKPTPKVEENPKVRKVEVKLDGLVQIKKNKDIAILEDLPRVPKNSPVQEIEKPIYDPIYYENWYNGNKQEQVFPEYCLQYACSLNDFKTLSWLPKIPRCETLESELALIKIVVQKMVAMDFPKIAGEAFILTILKALLVKNIISEESLIDWYESTEDFEGRKKALIQTTEWILQLVEKLEQEAEEEGEEEFIDFDNY
jgi:hypothetical protein